MASNIEKPQLISKKLIRPSSSTPPHLKQYKLSLLDQQITTKYIPIVFLYPNNAQTQQKCTSLFLQTSLSKILTSYYPLAGRLVDNVDIDCNDKGAIFIEAQVNFPMSEILKQPQNLHNVVFPKGLPWTSITQVNEEDRSLLVAQVTHFKCGAKSLGVCMSHKIGDARSLSNFIQDWAALNQDDACSKSCPKFDVASFLHPIEDPSIQLRLDGFSMPPDNTIIPRNYTFNGSKIRELKSRAIAETGIHNPTRVEVVTAFLFNCIYKLVPGNDNNTSFFQLANLRSFMDPPVSPSCFGNLYHLCHFNVHNSVKDQKDVSFVTFVTELRRCRLQFQDKFKGISAKELEMEIHALAEKMITMTTMTSADTRVTDASLPLQKNDIMDSYACTSWCGFNLYNVDFGWGKPEIVSIAPGKDSNIIVLMDDKSGDGIEAMISLPEEVITVFQDDPELFEFSSASSYV